MNSKQNIITFHGSFEGTSHKASGKPCQDASFSGTVCDKNIQYSVSIVADGHGSDNCFRSDRGSKFAVEAAKKSIRTFMSTVFSKENTFLKKRIFDDSENFMRQLERTILCEWIKLVNSDYKSAPFTAEEIDLMGDKHRKRYESDNEKYFVRAYGTTLIATVLCDKFWFGIHIGDGKCVVCSKDGVYSQPIPWDKDCFLNVTTSMCDSDASKRFRHCFSQNLPKAIFIGSDGIDDSFANDNDLHGFYHEVLAPFKGVKSKNKIKGLKREVLDYLPILSAKGSRDDISIGVIIA